MPQEVTLFDRQSLGKSIGLPTLTPVYLARLAYFGRGPAYYIVNGRAFYDRDEVLAWIRSCRVDPATKAAPAPVPAPEPRRRGRPTKAEQASRRRSTGGEG